MWQLMAASTALSIYGSYKQSKAEAKSLLAQAKMNEERSEETWRRYEYNVGLEKENLRQTLSSIRGSAAAKGIGGHAVEQAQAYTSDVVAKNLAEMRREALWDKKMAAAGVSALEADARSTRRAGYLNTLGVGLSGAATTANYYRQANPPKKEE